MARTVPRQGQDPWTVVLHPDRINQPLQWRKPRRIFVNSLSDLFHEDVPDEFIERVFQVMYKADQHTFQLLTKRPERMLDWISRSSYLCNAPIPNVWLGVSIENQETADERIQILLQTPAAVRFVSAEPLLGVVDFHSIKSERGYYDLMYRYGPGLFDRQSRRICDAKIDWVICGGESGPGARPCDVAWIRSIVQQCKWAGVPCFVKQLGSKPFSEADHISHKANAQKMENGFYRFLNDRKGGNWDEWPEDLRVREFPTKGAPG